MLLWKARTSPLLSATVPMIANSKWRRGEVGGNIMKYCTEYFLFLYNSGVKTPLTNNRKHRQMSGALWVDTYRPKKLESLDFHDNLTLSLQGLVISSIHAHALTRSIGTITRPTAFTCVWTIRSR